MEIKAVVHIGTAIDYIETHLNGNLDLGTVAAAVHYSKYHLHRMFTDAVGMAIHDYVQRRQLFEAAKLLVFSSKPIIEIALACGYESQRAFAAVFKAMYKTPPAQYRLSQAFYPLQLRVTLQQKAANPEHTAQSIRLAAKTDIPGQMELMHLVIDGYPFMDEADYLDKLNACINERRALILAGNGALIGAMAFASKPCVIESLGVHPQYRNCGIQKLFLNALLDTYLPGKEISITTYREGDKADTGHRDTLKELDFSERELLVEFGYPTQRFVLPPKRQEGNTDG